MQAGNMTSDTGRIRADKRHLAGFRKFQRAALKAVDIASRSLECEEPDCDVKARPAVKVSDMKSLVSAYKEAVVGERMVLGIDAVHHGGKAQDEPEELCLRWVVDETAGPGGEGEDIE